MEYILPIILIAVLSPSDGYSIFFLDGGPFCFYYRNNLGMGTVVDNFC